MNTSQNTICIVGKHEILQRALENINDFKACIPVKQLTPEIVKIIHGKNKNVVYAAKLDKVDFDNTNKIVKIVNGGSNFQKMEVGLSNIIEDFSALMDQHGIDVGDHAIHDSAKSGPKGKRSCMICRALEGTYVRKEHILYESKNFFVMPGLGAFFKGYVMICPKRHIMSFAECTPEEFEEFLQVLDDMKYILKSVYGKDVFVFECGTGHDGSGKHETSIVHAHVHLAPTDMPVLKCIQDSGIYPGLITPDDLSQYGEYSYMLYIDQEDNWYIASDPDTYYPRQHPRQVLADYMGLKKGEYNWRIYPHEEELDVIASEIYEFLKKNYNKLPSWIQKNVSKFMQEFPKGTE